MMPWKVHSNFQQTSISKSIYHTVKHTETACTLYIGANASTNCYIAVIVKIKLPYASSILVATALNKSMNRTNTLLIVVQNQSTPVQEANTRLLKQRVLVSLFPGSR